MRTLRRAGHFSDAECGSIRCKDGAGSTCPVQAAEDVKLEVDSLRVSVIASLEWCSQENGKIGIRLEAQPCMVVSEMTHLLNDCIHERVILTVAELGKVRKRLRSVLNVPVRPSRHG